jgi:hypothetical protein
MDWSVLISLGKLQHTLRITFQHLEKCDNERTFGPGVLDEPAYTVQGFNEIKNRLRVIPSPFTCKNLQSRILKEPI